VPTAAEAAIDVDVRPRGFDDRCSGFSRGDARRSSGTEYDVEVAPTRFYRAGWSARRERYHHRRFRYRRARAHQTGTGRRYLPRPLERGAEVESRVTTDRSTAGRAAQRVAGADRGAASRRPCGGRSNPCEHAVVFDHDRMGARTRCRTRDELDGWGPPARSPSHLLRRMTLAPRRYTLTSVSKPSTGPLRAQRSALMPIRAPHRDRKRRPQIRSRICGCSSPPIVPRRTRVAIADASAGESVVRWTPTARLGRWPPSSEKPAHCCEVMPVSARSHEPSRRRFDGISDTPIRRRR